jgi:hypothetical protein
VDDANPWLVVAEVARALEALGIRYAVGGSLASSLAGEPRSTQDADISVDLRPEHVDALINGLSGRFYVPAERLRRAAHERLSVNVIHLDTAMKVDLFVAGGTPIDEDVLRRRVPFSPPSASRTLYVYTPEDVLLHKLRWYQRGGATSERQWRDIIGIIRVQGPALDRGYLGQAASTLGVSELLARACAEE